MKFEFLFKGKLAENGLTLSKFAEDIGTSPQNLTQRVKIQQKLWKILKL